MYKATNESRYLTKAQKYYDPTPDWGMSWDDVIIGCQVLMYELTGEENYKQDVQGTFTSWFPGGTIPYSPKGLAYRLQWGSLRYASNMAAMALMAAYDGIDTEEYRHWAMCQIHYALGDTGRSFVVGYGVNPPLQPHHRARMFVLIVLTAHFTLTSCDIIVPITNHWNGGFQGEACFSITEELNSWHIHLHFDQAITSLEVWTADIVEVSADRTEYTLGNKDWNRIEHVGDTLCVNFLGHGSGDISPVVTASIDNIEGGGTFTVGTTRMDIPSGVGVSGTMTIINDWSNRFEGQIDFPVTENIEGWMVNITFSKPVTQMDIFIGQAYAHSTDGYNWIVINKGERAFYKPGETVELRFFGNFQGGGTAPEAQAVLINLGVDRNWTVTCPPNSELKCHFLD